MFDSIDSQKEIVLAKLSNLLKKYSYRVIRENGDGENLLRSSGISSLLNEYSQFLNPHYYSNGYRHDNYSFNPGFCISGICLKISGNKEILGKFLSEFLSRITEIDEDNIEAFENYLEVLGYKLNIEKCGDRKYSFYKYSLAPFTEGAVERQSDVSYLLDMLINNNSELVTYYEDAISTYGNSEYKSCIEAVEH